MIARVLPTVAAMARLAAFDLVRWWPLCVASVGLEIWRAVETEVALHATPGAAAATLFPGGIGALDALLSILAVATTVLLAQADHPDDDQSFWRTRPIAPGTLAVATIALLGLCFVVVPAAIDAIRLAAYGAPVSSMVVAAGQTAARAGFLILPAWALALATRTPSRFVGTLAALVVAAYAFSLVASWAETLLWRFRGPGPSRAYPALLEPLVDWQRQNRHGWTGGLLLTTLGLGILVRFYATRRTAVAVAGGIALAVAPNIWPAGDTVGRAAPDVAAAIGTSMAFPAGVTVPTRYWIERMSGRVGVEGPIVLPGLPAGMAADIAWGRVRLFPAASVIEAAGLEQHELGVDPIDVVRGVSPARHDRPYANDLFQLERPDALRLLGSRVAIEGDAIVTVTERRIIGTLPLASGQSLRAGGVLLEILDVSSYRDGPVARVRLARFPTFGSAFDRILTVFVTDTAGAVVLPTLSYWGGYQAPPSSSVWSWGTSRNWVERFDVGLDGADGLPGRPGVRLVVVESRTAGRVHATLRADDVTVHTRN